LAVVSVVCFVAILGTPPSAAGQAATPTASARPDDALDWRVVRKQVGRPVTTRLDQLLRSAAQGQTAQAAKDLGAFRRGSTVLVKIRADQAQHSAIKTLVNGIVGQVDGAVGDWIYAYLSPTGLRQVADHPAVRHMDLGDVFRPIAGELTRADALGFMGTAAWHGNGMQGTGVRLGILDQGFAGFQTELTPGTWDTSCANVFAPVVNNDPLGSHGREVAQIVQSVAPRAKLYLVNVMNPAQQSAAIDCLVNRGVTIVNQSLIQYYSSDEGPGDGTGASNSRLDSAVSRGIFWVNGSGNSRKAHWNGFWNDPLGNNSYDFGSGYEATEVKTPVLGKPYSVYLRWEDTWGCAGFDFDLYIWSNRDRTGQPVRTSIDAQPGCTFFSY
jgi:hypothetical protein